ncbi:DUF1203 domain-containing protein [Streptomyces axinellae]|uniref:DUF1203 domain-containing protein n=1 Tax=Streptomyces axinellae TaxID=552788 RepID=UPI0031DF9642
MSVFADGDPAPGRNLEHTDPIYDIRAISPGVLDGLRVTDDTGATPRSVVDADGGSPPRCRMERSKPGETVSLVSYAALRKGARGTGADPGAYGEVGDGLHHLYDCGGRRGPSDAFPEAMPGERRMPRAFSAEGHALGVLGGLLLGGTRERTAAVEEGRTEAYADPRVAPRTCGRWNPAASSSGRGAACGAPGPARPGRAGRSPGRGMDSGMARCVKLRESEQFHALSRRG